MVWFWFFGFLALVALDQLLQLYIRIIVREHQFHLYALRDELRESAICGEVNAKNWVFHYLDSSIAKTIDVLAGITLWKVLIVRFSSPTSERFLRSRMHLQQELAKPQ